MICNVCNTIIKSGPRSGGGAYSVVVSPKGDWCIPCKGLIGPAILAGRVHLGCEHSAHIPLPGCGSSNVRRLTWGLGLLCQLYVVACSRTREKYDLEAWSLDLT